MIFQQFFVGTAFVFLLLLFVSPKHFPVSFKFPGLDPSDAVNSGLKFMGQRVGNAGGAICINAKGQTGFGFNSERMAWAKITSNEASSGVEPGDSIPF